MWLELPFIESCFKRIHSLYPVAKYAYTTIPSYPSGQIGFFLASKNKVNKPRQRGRVCVINLSLFRTLYFRNLYVN